MGGVNIHISDTNGTLGLAFKDLLQLLRIKQNVIGPIYCSYHTLDLILSHGIEFTDLDIVHECHVINIVQ